jgi:hypothetical protein
MKTLDMRFIRYLNLFERTCNVRTRFCFDYNSAIIYAVPAEFVARAIGENGRNAKRLREVLGKNIKIISQPSGDSDIRRFVLDVIDPLKFKEMQISANEVVINAGSQYKAALLGRNKRRLLELQRIVKDFFNRDLKII